MSKDYKTYLRAKGRTPMTAKVRDSLRASREPGSVEIAYDPRTGDYEIHRHEGEVSNVVPIRKRRVA